MMRRWKTCAANSSSDAWPGEQWLGGKMTRGQADQTRSAAVPAEAHWNKAWSGATQ
jgi:hypothetical protein